MSHAAPNIAIEWWKREGGSDDYLISYLRSWCKTNSCHTPRDRLVSEVPSALLPLYHTNNRVAWNKKTIAEQLIMGGNGAKVIGSPTTCADELERWSDIADVDGFNLSYASIPETFDDLIEHLIPELRKRGLFWDDYAVPGGTLRENYLGVKGKTRLDDSHPGAKFFWKAGEETPEYARKTLNGATKRSADEANEANGHGDTSDAKRHRGEE